MKKILFVGFLLLTVFSVRAQVGIGTPIPSQSSQLDVVASDKGVLLPRVRLMSTTDQETITNGNISSLLVFNIMEINDVTPGYYYWYNGKWNRLGGGGASDETITTLINNGAGVYTYTSEDGTVTEINVTQDVLDDIMNQGAIYSAILDLIGTQGDQIITVLQDNNDGTYTYYNENEVDAQGNITGTGVTIDIPNSVINNFEQIVNGGPVVINGETYNTIEEYLESLGGGQQTLTVLNYDENTHILTYLDENQAIHTIELNASTLISEIDGDILTLTYTNEKGETTINELNKTGIAYDMDSQMLTFTNLFGETQSFDIGMLIEVEQTLTVLTYDEGTHTLSYMDEHEVTHEIELNASTLISEIDGDTLTLTYVNEKGETTTVELNKTGIAYDMDSQMLTFTNLFGETQSFDIGMLIEVEQTLTVLTYDEGTHTLSYMDEHEVTHEIELNASTLVSEIDGDTLTLTYVNEKGETTTVELNKTGIAYDMDSQMLTFTNLFGETQSFDIGMLIEVEQTLTVLTYDEGTHTLSYMDEHEVTHEIELNASTLVSEVDGDTLTLTYVNEKGETTTVELNKTGIAYDMDSQMLTFTNLFGETQSFDIGMLIEVEQTLTVLTYDNTNHTFIYKDEDGVEHEYVLNFGEVFYNSEGSKDIFFYKNARGEETRIEYDNSNGILAFHHEGELVVKYDLVEFVRDNQSLTSLNYDNSTHTLSYVDEKGDQYQIPLNAGKVSIEKAGNIDKYIYNDAHGNQTTFEYNNSNGIFKIYDDEGHSNEYDFVDFVRNVQTMTKLEEGPNASLVYSDEENQLSHIKSVMPKFFYMPPTAMPTDASQLPLSHVSESGGVFTVDLYGMYAEQFGGTNSTSSVSNPGQTASLPVLPASELDYNITYFNNAIFTNVSVSDAGILTYQIASGANTDGAYMNIVFAVK